MTRPASFYVGVILLAFGVLGLGVAAWFAWLLTTSDISCTYNPQCGTNALLLVLGLIVGLPGVVVGSVLLRHKPAALANAAPSGGSHPAWALICGAIALAVAMVCGFLALNWVLGYLSDASNPFAGLALLLGLGAGVVAAGFLILGIMLLAKKS